MTYEDMEAALQDWIADTTPWSRHGGYDGCFRFSRRAHGEEDAGRLIFCTAKNTYTVNFRSSYLQCGATSRTVQAGEDWHRGNDLPDGDFSRHTWDRIIRAVFGYEVVRLVEERPPVSVEQEPAAVPG